MLFTATRPQGSRVDVGGMSVFLEEKLQFASHFLMLLCFTNNTVVGPGSVEMSMCTF